jgi:predicted RecB family nuclease
MQKSSSVKLFSASDLVNFAACVHLTHLDLVNLETPLPKTADSDEMVLIQDKGFEHEGRYLQHLRTQHGAVVDLKEEGISDVVAAANTRRALESGANVLFQPTFFSAPWVGHADFLVRVETPSLLGGFSYEVVDTKLARSSRAKFLLQLCLYSEMLAEVQGFMPRHMYVVLGDGCKETFLVANYLRYYRQLKQRFLDWTAQAERNSYPERCDRCSMCRWRDLCTGQWDGDDHLNRVAGITRVQIPRLKAAGISTMKSLAALPTQAQIPRIQADTKNRLAHQARLQVQTLETGKPVFELLPLSSGKGFERLPPASDGDLFFDMEGDPLEEGGLEYLFGLYYFEAGQPVFKPFWGHSRAEEKVAFEAFIDFVKAHLAQWPRAHVYHYAPYEPTALKRLMSLHGTREDEVDNLLRQQKLVDLYAVVREGLRVGEPSYSIKYIEHFYGPARSGDVKTAGASIVFYEQWKATGDAALLQAIEDYNKDDVVSTYELRQWLISIRPQELAPVGIVVASEQPPVREKSKAALDVEAAMEWYRHELMSSLPADPLTWSDEDRNRELMFQLLGFHRRTEKPVWWALFARQQATEEELLDDMEVIACLAEVRPPIPTSDGWSCQYNFPEQEFKVKTGDSCVIVESLVEVENVVVDEDGRVVSFIDPSKDQPPGSGLSLGTGLPINTGVIQKAYKRFVDAYLSGTEKFLAGLDLLKRAIPRVQSHELGLPLIRHGEDLLAATIRVVAGLSNSYLFIQGPPGAGKTFTGSHVIVELLKAGKTVAVTSNSHKAINNLLQAVEKVADATGFSFKGVKKSSSPESCINGKLITDSFNTQEIIKHVDGYCLIAGTAWLFSSPKLEQKFDYLFVDEAGQVSLANLIAMSTCAKNLVLLGDQMQLGQPIQGVHPGESGTSTLEFLLKGEATIAAEAGIFLKDTWRMHPDVCRFISEAVYDGRLEAEPANVNQRLVLDADAHPLLKPTGVRFLSVEHDGCAQRSEVEADIVKGLFHNLLGQRYVDRDGVEHAMDLSNILVVAPYNQQVNLLKRVLPEGARVGTVDKFQGQEAEAVLVSMTTSSGQYLPRDIEFLYSKNRLNVAVSRARSLAVVVASPRLLDVDCNTPEQMALVNTLCWIRDYSDEFTQKCCR